MKRADRALGAISCSLPRQSTSPRVVVPSITAIGLRYRRPLGRFLPSVDEMHEVLNARFLTREHAPLH
jgi:hypothetical protein